MADWDAIILGGDLYAMKCAHPSGAVSLETEAGPFVGVRYRLGAAARGWVRRMVTVALPKLTPARLVGIKAGDHETQLQDFALVGGQSRGQ